MIYDDKEKYIHYNNYIIYYDTDDDEFSSE